MTKEARNPKREEISVFVPVVDSLGGGGEGLRHSSFVILSSLDIRHSSFVICYSSRTSTLNHG
jgi:hypothetical protein